MLVSIAAIITLAAQFIFLFNFFYSMFRGRLAPANPWNSTTLEWTTPRNPGHGNWPGEIPSVYRWPYDYSKPGAKEDFIPQTIPFSETPESNLPHENELIKLESSDGHGAIIVEGRQALIINSAECERFNVSASSALNLTFELSIVLKCY